ncbi:MAG: hypothetical protein Q8S84_02080 [bacterium]|nr:hypothetical protein [bacterium]MDP3380344.1 hypothetical protein [bacterium]
MSQLLDSDSIFFSSNILYGGLYNFSDKLSTCRFSLNTILCPACCNLNQNSVSSSHHETSDSSNHQILK